MHSGGRQLLSGQLVKQRCLSAHTLTAQQAPRNQVMHSMRGMLSMHSGADLAGTAAGALLPLPTPRRCCRPRRLDHRKGCCSCWRLCCLQPPCWP